MAASSSNSHGQTSDDELDLNETARSIQEQLRQYRLTVYDAARFPGFVADVDRINSFIRKGIEHSLDAAMDLEKLQKDQEVKALTDKVPVFIDCEKELNTQKEIFLKLASRIQRGEAISDITDAYNQEWNREKAKYRVMSNKKKYYTHSQFEDYRQALWEINHPDEPLPPYNAGAEEEDDDDDDLVVGQMKRSLKCPLTQTWLENPVTSKICRHIFSKSAIFALIRRNRGRCQCPLPGCGKMLDENSFYDDTMVERRVARAKEEASMHQTQTNFYDVE